MASTLVFPDGVRLASREEIPGPEADRLALWARVQAADIGPGYVLTQAVGERFNCYAEANVDAPLIWPVFRDLCQALLGPEATVLFGAIDDEPRELGTARTSTILDVLSRFSYQLAHDGYLQFGAVSDDDAINEVLVAPTKHFKIWVGDEASFRSVMNAHRIPEVSQLEFLDQYPRTTTTLSIDKGVFRDPNEFASHLESEIATGGQRH